MKGSKPESTSLLQDRSRSAIEKARDILSLYGRECVEKTIWSSPAGKKRLSKMLASLLPSHKTYVEPLLTRISLPITSIVWLAMESRITVMVKPRLVTPGNTTLQTFLDTMIPLYQVICGISTNLRAFGQGTFLL